MRGVWGMGQSRRHLNARVPNLQAPSNCINFCTDAGGHKLHQLRVDGHTSADVNADRHRSGHADSDRHAHSLAHGHADTNSYPYAYTHANAHSYARAAQRFGTAVQGQRGHGFDYQI